MQNFLTLEDVGVLRSKGWKAGPTGHAWYGTDKFGDVWRAYEEVSSDRLLFSVEASGKSWGPTDYMTREDFDEQFSTH